MNSANVGYISFSITDGTAFAIDLVHVHNILHMVPKPLSQICTLLHNSLDMANEDLQCFMRQMYNEHSFINDHIGLWISAVFCGY